MARPKGSKNLATLNKSRFFQDRFNEETIEGWTNTIKERMSDPTLCNAEFVQLFNAVSKFVLLTKREYTEYEMMIEVVDEIVSSKDEAAALKEKIREYLNK